jgi:O-antigen/teichoic acid export membrane protein
LNNKFLTLIKNFSYTLSSNVVSLLISTVVVLILPKLVGVEEYGYWQLYLLYSSYVGFIILGWNDGIYLRYGGEEYEKLNKQLFFSQFLMSMFSQVVVGVLLFLMSSTFVDWNEDRVFILKMVAFVLIIVNTRSILLFILQATNRIKSYARITILDRIIYFILIVFLLLFSVYDYKLIIIADIFGKLVSFFYALYCCKEIVFRKISTFYFSFDETIKNISVGIKLMLAGIASMLIIGNLRFGIERTWDVSIFGQISLTLSITNLIMLFINAIGIVMFPLLRRTDKGKLPEIYETMRDLLMVILLGVLITYYPLKLFITWWLPQYKDILVYMSFLFPMFIFEGKMALLINTYLKTLRKEKLMLGINIVSFLLSIFFTLLTTQILKNLDFAILSIIILIAFRCTLAELFLSKMLNINIRKDTILELCLTVIFLTSSWFIDSIQIIIIYSISYIFYLIIKRRELIFTAKRIKLLMVKNERGLLDK